MIDICDDEAYTGGPVSKFNLITSSCSTAGRLTCSSTAWVLGRNDGDGSGIFGRKRQDCLGNIGRYTTRIILI